jgi:quercetin dioxygenase-like cupin family protein
MTRYNWTQVKREQLNPLLARQMIHGEKLTIARIHLAKGCIVPEHAHDNEQVSVLERGKLRFRVAGDEVLLEAGDVLHIPSGAPHDVEALEDSLAMDIFSPAREDWRSGDDAYLRR